MPVSIIHEYLMHAVYFAPRGRYRLLALGGSLAHRYLSPDDHLIGFIGDAGAGKSLLIRGMFPGLELTNDDDGINVRPLPLLDDFDRKHFRSRTYHLDMRFEMAFTQPWTIVEAVQEAIKKDRRVIVEHFDLLYPMLKINAQILLGIGEEVIVTRPNIFGPEPQEIADIVYESLIYRKMAHTAEDITSLVLTREFGMKKPKVHSDIKHGFVLEFDEQPKIDLKALEERVQEIIDKDICIYYNDETHIKVGEFAYPCTGPRLHVKRTSEVKNFRLVKEFKWDPIQELYVMVGLVGPVEGGSPLTPPDQFQLMRRARNRSKGIS
ncbi:alanine-tRNA synthetase second additional domain-containing protein [Desulforamulus ruminis]|uniref:alanine-tRNA synthetase second additional domain-containing protein n=1 Tax=Desulforamulus ruminis TaxID=1564 RepID=UPI002355B8CF|nr:alanine-tRNA synthetase second additional domain-containing protein [Desulforamulus ruminis]